MEVVRLRPIGCVSVYGLNDPGVDRCVLETNVLVGFGTPDSRYQIPSLVSLLT